MRTSSPRSTSCCPASDVKYLAHAPALGRGPLSTRALTVWEQANGTCVLVHPAGLEPACPWATPFEGVVYPGSTTDACSPCLLVKGTDCAGDVHRVGVVICRSLRVLFLGSHGPLEHVNVAVRT